MNYNQMLDEEEPPVEFELGEEEEQAIMEEQERWQLVADGLLAAADQELFHPERQDWTLDEWIDWGTNTFFEPVADIEGWQDVLREAFTADFGEGSSRFWGDYIADVSDRIVSHLQQLRDRTIVGDEREEVEDEDESSLEGNGRPLKLLELFKGTGSIGKAAKKLGFQVVSLDFDPIYTPDIETDILKWDYKKYHKETGYVPDLIWSSPPCNTFSPYSARAKEGTAILQQTLKIINYFQKLNPELLFVMENPRGMMRHDPEVKKLPNRDTTLYCFYGDARYKPTDFFNNIPQGLELKEGKSCNKPIVLIADLPLNKRYEIPAKLSREILETMRDAYKKPIRGGAFQNPPQRTPEEVRRISRQARNEYLRTEIRLIRAILQEEEQQERQQRERMRQLEDQWTYFTAQLTQELQEHLVDRGDERLELEVDELNRELERRQQLPPIPDSMQGGAKTHREKVLKRLGLEEKGYSLKELADASGVSKSILQEVYNRGIGAYKTNPQSVRMKGTFKKNVSAPMSKKLSKEQWGMARVYSFLNNSPKHDQDLRE